MSAALPAPVPRDPATNGAPSAPDGDRPPGGRPALVIAPGPGPTAPPDDDPVDDAALDDRPRDVDRPVPAPVDDACPDAPVQREPGGPPHVRLVALTDPPATVLGADAPAHVRPPALGSPSALARPRPLVGVAERATDTSGGAPLPDPTRLCCAVVQAAVEGLRGVRPLAQLVRWVTPEVYERLALRAHLVQHAAVPPAPGRAGIRRVRVFRIGDGAAEATVVVDDGPRVRAVALRVEEHRGRWRATVLEIG